MRNHRSWRFESRGFDESCPSEPAAAAFLEVVGDEGHHLVVEMVDHPPILPSEEDTKEHND